MNFNNLNVLASKFEDIIKNSNNLDPQLQSPNIIIEPIHPIMDKAVKLLRRMDPSYFVGTRKIVIGASSHYGHVESGPGKDPSIININLHRIINESQGGLNSPMAVLAAATTIAHEKGHVSSFDSARGFVGGEAPAEAEEIRVRHWIEANMNKLQDLLR